MPASSTGEEGVRVTSAESEVDRSGIHLILGDSAQAPDLAPSFVGRVALAVTSPPYHNAISYASHVVDPRANYRTREAISYEGQYLPMLRRVWAACHRMLMPGGYLAVNVGTVLMDGHHFPLPQDITADLETAGEPWEFVRAIIWNKVTAGVKRAGSVIKHRLPGYWYPNILTEHIIVVRKPGPMRTLNNDVPPEWWAPTWDLAPVPPGQVPHPAPFPEDLPHRLIRMLTTEGDVVMDPFLGAGATTKAAYDLSRVGLGFDIESKYLEYARKRLRAPSMVRPLQLRISTVPVERYVPRRSRGRTRHGAGLATRKR